jgi:hypothetical protein
VSRKFIPVICGILVFSIILMPATASAAALSIANANRQTVIHRLEQLGATPKQAETEVAMLNDHDLATLAAHPQMIHRAGATDTGREVFWGVVILLVIVGATAAIVAA